MKSVEVSQCDVIVKLSSVGWQGVYWDRIFFWFLKQFDQSFAFAQIRQSYFIVNFTLLNYVLTFSTLHSALGGRDSKEWFTFEWKEIAVDCLNIFWSVMVSKEPPGLGEEL